MAEAIQKKLKAEIEKYTYMQKGGWQLALHGFSHMVPYCVELTSHIMRFIII